MMTKYLVGQSEEFCELMIVHAEDEDSALNFYLGHIQPDKNFLDNLHDWSTNMSLSEQFHFNEETEGQTKLPKKEIQRRVDEYFKEKPEYVQIYWKHWNAKAPDGVFTMQKFPDDMIDWIFRKELHKGDWTSFRVINLDEIQTF